MALIYAAPFDKRYLAARYQNLLNHVTPEERCFMNRFKNRVKYLV